jgi:hypothetical protein
VAKTAAVVTDDRTGERAEEKTAAGIIRPGGHVGVGGIVIINRLRAVNVRPIKAWSRNVAVTVVRPMEIRVKYRGAMIAAVVDRRTVSFGAPIGVPDRASDQ